MRFPKWLSRFAVERSSGDLALIEAVSEHVEKWVGKVSVLHEAKSEIVHVDVYRVPPDEDRPFYTLVTSGMAQLPMHPPVGAEKCTHAELVMFLPPDWPMDSVTTDDSAYWPVAILQLLARYPHQQR